MLDLNLLQTLCQAQGVSGQERAVREIILKEIKEYADDYKVDNLGNLIVFKKGAQRPQTKLMISAHMDEVGFIVTYITKEGFLKFSPVGGIDRRVVAGRSVTIGEHAVSGVIGVKPIHLLKGEEKEKVAPIEELYIDIGAESQEEAANWVRPGDFVCFDSCFEVSGGRILSKALDDRVGCLILLEMIRTPLPYDMYFSFVVQEEIGLRGATVAAYSIKPDAAIVVESTTASDIAGVDEEKQVCRMGEGAVISFIDRRTIYDRQYYQLAFEAAQSVGVKCQAKQAVAGGNDAGAIHVSRGGVRTLAVSLPCRYLHSAVSMISVEDLDAVAKTVFKAAEMIAGMPV